MDSTQQQNNNNNNQDRRGSQRSLATTTDRAMYSTQQYPHPFHNPHHAMHAHGHLEPVMEGLANHGTFVPPAQSQRSAAQFPHNAYPGSLGTYHSLYVRSVPLKL